MNRNLVLSELLPRGTPIILLANKSDAGKQVVKQKDLDIYNAKCGYQFCRSSSFDSHYYMKFLSLSFLRKDTNISCGYCLKVNL